MDVQCILSINWTLDKWDRFFRSLKRMY